MMTSKLPNCMGIRSIEKACSLRVRRQSRRMESTKIDLPLATSTENDLGSLERAHFNNDSNSKDTKLLSAFDTGAERDGLACFNLRVDGRVRSFRGSNLGNDLWNDASKLIGHESHHLLGGARL